MSTTTINYLEKGLQVQRRDALTGWRRVAVLSVLGYEAAGGLTGGVLLTGAPDGRWMEMPVDIMHGVFRDFFIPGIILFVMGVLTSIAFFAVLRRTRYDWLWAALALVGFTIWFWVEITILQGVHWLHIMWGLPVLIGCVAAIPLLPYSHAEIRKFFLICGILSSAVYVAMNAFIPLMWKGYDFTSQQVSELSAIGAVTRPVWISFGILYSLLMMAFGYGVWNAAQEKRSMRMAGISLMAYAAIGPFWLFFAPMHLREVIAAGGGTASDTMHIVFTGATIFFMLLSMIFGAVSSGKSFRIYTMVTILILIVFGVMTSLQAPQLQANLPTPMMGVWERINIGVFIVWVVVFAEVILRSAGVRREE